MVKQCTKCKQTKELEKFTVCKLNKDGRYSSCKECNNKRVKSYYRANSAKCRKAAAAYRKTNVTPEKTKNYMLKYDYGITIETYQQMLTSQDGKCAICKSKEFVIDKRTGKIRDLCVDHCHKTGKIRGLLCNGCNKAIGLLNDRSDLCRNAADYLAQHK